VVNNNLVVMQSVARFLYTSRISFAIGLSSLLQPMSAEKVTLAYLYRPIERGLYTVEAYGQQNLGLVLLHADHREDELHVTLPLRTDRALHSSTLNTLSCEINRYHLFIPHSTIRLDFSLIL